MMCIIFIYILSTVSLAKQRICVSTVNSVPEKMTTTSPHQNRTDCVDAVELAECCFTSTATVGLLGTVAQDGHLDFHTAPEL